MPKPSDLKGRTAVITGAASGIGRAIALSLSRRGCHLALADIDRDGLAKTGDLAGPGVRISLHEMDVTDAAAIVRLRDAVVAAHGGADILFNNAGVAVGGLFAEVPETDFDWLFEINFRATVRMTRVFLPLLEAGDGGRIVNISSIFGIIAPLGQTAYAASKFAVRGFTEALRHELEGTPVGVTLVHPGGVDTSIARNARISGPTGAAAEQARRSFQTKLRLSPDRAGEIIVRAVERRKARILVGADAKAAALVQRLAPTAYWRILEPYAGEAVNALQNRARGMD